MSQLFENLKKFVMIVAMLLPLIIVGCHSAEIRKEAESKPAEVGAPVSAPGKATESLTDPSTVPAPSRDRVLDSYSYLQLSEAASAYKILADENLGRVPETTSPNVFGCTTDVQEIKAAQVVIRDLIDSKLPREQSSYLRGTKSYLKTRGVSDCTKTCTCGAILDVLSSLDVRVLNKAEQARHEEMLLELQSKSAKQGPEATMECARQQKWICKSDLQRYLKARRAE